MLPAKVPFAVPGFDQTPYPLVINDDQSGNTNEVSLLQIISDVINVELSNVAFGAIVTSTTLPEILLSQLLASLTLINV